MAKNFCLNLTQIKIIIIMDVDDPEEIASLKRALLDVPYPKTLCIKINRIPRFGNYPGKNINNI